MELGWGVGIILCYKVYTIKFLFCVYFLNRKRRNYTWSQVLLKKSIFLSFQLILFKPLTILKQTNKQTYNLHYFYGGQSRSCRVIEIGNPIISPDLWSDACHFWNIFSEMKWFKNLLNYINGFREVNHSLRVKHSTCKQILWYCTHLNSLESSESSKKLF